jgi:hypothetical protein
MLFSFARDDNDDGDENTASARSKASCSLFGASKGELGWSLCVDVDTGLNAGAKLALSVRISLPSLLCARRDRAAELLSRPLLPLTLLPPPPAPAPLPLLLALMGEFAAAWSAAFARSLASFARPALIPSTMAASVSLLFTAPPVPPAEKEGARLEARLPFPAPEPAPAITLRPRAARLGLLDHAPAPAPAPSSPSSAKVGKPDAKPAAAAARRSSSVTLSSSSPSMMRPSLRPSL